MTTSVPRTTSGAIIGQSLSPPFDQARAYAVRQKSLQGSTAKSVAPQHPLADYGQEHKREQALQSEARQHIKGDQPQEGRQLKQITVIKRHVPADSRLFPDEEHNRQQREGYKGRRKQTSPA